MIGIIPLFLVLATPATAPQNAAVHNGRALVDRDWWSCSFTSDRDKTLRLLSLRPGDSWAEGTAWLMDIRTQSHPSQPSTAYQGVYEIFNDKLKEGTLQIHIGLTRRFDGKRSHDHINWTLSSSYRENPLGMMLEIPLQGGAVPDKSIIALIARTHCVTPWGAPTVRRYSTGFLSWDVERVRRVGPFNEGESLELTNSALDESRDEVRAGRMLEESPPVGFKLRDNVRPPLVKAKEYARDGHVERASRIIDSILKTDPADADALRQRGMMRYDRREYRLAIEDFTNSAAVASLDMPSLMTRANCHAFLGDTEKAIADLDAAIEMQPIPCLFWARGGHRLKLKDYRGSRSDFERLIELDPMNLENKNLLAWYLATHPDSKMRDGREAYRLAAAVHDNGGRTNWRYLDTLAAAYAELGDFPHAIQYQSEAVRLAPPESREVPERRLYFYRSSHPWRENPFK